VCDGPRRLFVVTLGYRRKCVRLVTFQSSTRIWAELHERAYRKLGGAVKIVVPTTCARRSQTRHDAWHAKDWPV